MSLLKGIARLFGPGGTEATLARPHEDLLASLLVMAWMVEARDPYTSGHLWRVSRFSRLLAQDAGLAGAAVPLDARLVGICDAFDAMTSSRPYRKGMPIVRALSIIEENLGRQFDRDFGGRFLALGRAGALDHIAGHSDEGIPLHECMMCGPTLVVRREQKAGEHVYCRNCGGEYATEMRDGRLETVSTGRQGAPKELEAEADTALIARLVRESARALLAG